jgi:hypothetical protein
MRKQSVASEPRVILFAGPVTTLAISPFWSYDAINIPKFVSLTIFGSIAWLLVFFYLENIRAKNFRMLRLFAVMFLVNLLLVMVLSKGNLTQQIFGASGRNTGIISYLSFVGILIACASISNEALMKRIGNSLILTALISNVYGFIQAVGADPFDWTNPYSPVFGFLGNPNFLSSFLGVASVVAFGFALEKKAQVQVKVGYLLFVIFSLYIIFETKSLQGFLVFLIGAIVVLYFKIKEFKSAHKFSIVYLTAAAISMIAIIGGILQKGPLESQLYKNSISERGDFWRAGWNMTKDHLFFGVGFDGYRDWYRRYRDAIAVERSGPGFVSDSAHNVFLDLSSGAGLPILVIYLSLLGYALISGIRVVRRNPKVDFGFISVFAAWLAYTAQSVISISQIGLAIWGWIFAGLIIGFELNTRDSNSKEHLKHEKPKRKNLKGSLVSLGVISGMMISGPVYISDARFRLASDSGDALKVVDSVNHWPQDVLRMTIASSLLIDSNLHELGLRIAQDATQFSPETYAPWQLIAGNEAASEAIKRDAIARMKKLDPLNDNLN